ncbi:hypothetical protein ACFE04_030103 [Oxalis oulophora]
MDFISQAHSSSISLLSTFKRYGLSLKFSINTSDSQADPEPESVEETETEAIEEVVEVEEAKETFKPRVKLGDVMVTFYFDKEVLGFVKVYRLIRSVCYGVLPIPRSAYGKFFMGDSYVVLKRCLVRSPVQRGDGPLALVLAPMR